LPDGAQSGVPPDQVVAAAMSLCVIPGKARLCTKFWMSAGEAVQSIVREIRLCRTRAAS
jgi:hypothetical protein